VHLQIPENFKRSLGKINAASECTELAIRSFIDGARKAPSADAYIQQLSGAYKVKVDTVDLDALSAQISQYHIVSVHQQFELFLREFRSEHRIRNGRRWKVMNFSRAH
jgi:3-dehydroquinate dehydratase